MTRGKGSRGGAGAYRSRSPAQVHVCEFCGGVFYAKRSHAKTCSTKCRVALCRRDKKQMEIGGRLVEESLKQMPLNMSPDLFQKIAVGTLAEMLGKMYSNASPVP